MVGRHCESGDVLVDGVRLAAPRVGDLLARAGDGRLLLHDGQQLQRAPRRIPVVFVADGAARLVVRRETWADLLARDVE